MNYCYNHENFVRIYFIFFSNMNILIRIYLFGRTPGSIESNDKLKLHALDGYLSSSTNINFSKIIVYSVSVFTLYKFIRMYWSVSNVVSRIRILAALSLVILLRSNYFLLKEAIKTLLSRYYYVVRAHF